MGSAIFLALAVSPPLFSKTANYSVSQNVVNSSKNLMYE